jgi:predicted porin
MRIRNIIRYCLLATGCGISLPLFAAKPYYDLGVDLRYSDNLGNAPYTVDKLSSHQSRAQASVVKNLLLTTHSGLLLKGAIETQQDAKYRGLDHHTLSFAASYKIKPDLAYSAPWYSLALKYTAAIYPESKLRDARIIELEFMGGKRFTDRILAKAALAYREHNTEQSHSPFEQRQQQLMLGLDYHYQKLTVYTNYNYIDGHIASTVSNMCGAYVYCAADDALLRNKDGDMLYAYRRNAQTHLADLGFNYAFSRSTSLDFMFRRIDARASGYSNYEQHSAHFGLFYRIK